MIEQLIGKIYLLEKRRQFSDFESVFPKQIDLESTNICNLRCPICPQPKITRKIGYLKFDLAGKVIEEINKYGLEVQFSYKDLISLGEKYGREKMGALFPG